MNANISKRELCIVNTGRHIEQANDYTFFYGKENGNHFRTSFLGYTKESTQFNRQIFMAGEH